MRGSKGEHALILEKEYYNRHYEVFERQNSTVIDTRKPSEGIKAE